MGHHYLPRRLLKNFSSSDLIWMFDKTGKQEPKELPIGKVAQEPGMYPQSLEERLTNEIEQPFNLVLESIEEGRGLYEENREAIAKYVLTAFRRVPRGRNKSRTLFPEVALAVKNETLARIDLLHLISPGDRELAESGKRNVQEIFERLEANNADWLWHDTLLPDRFKKIIPTLSNMAWKLVKAPPGKQFVIGDTPVLFDEELGLGHPRAILIMPIASDLAMVATHGVHQNGDVRMLTAKQVHAINTESTVKAQRWVFALRNEKWIHNRCTGF